MRLCFAGAAIAAAMVASGCATTFVFDVQDRETGDPSAGYWIRVQHFSKPSFFAAAGPPMQLDKHGEAQERIGLFDYRSNDIRAGSTTNVYLFDSADASAPILATFSCTTPQSDERVQADTEKPNGFEVWVQKK